MTGDRDELFAELLAWGVKADCYSKLVFAFEQRRQNIDDADGGDCEISHAESKKFFIIKYLQARFHVFKVECWFAHAHVDNVCDFLTPFFEEASEVDNLFDDLICGEVARQTKCARGAELAADRATDLCRDTNCVAVFLTN